MPIEIGRVLERQGIVLVEIDKLSKHWVQSLDFQPFLPSDNWDTDVHPWAHPAHRARCTPLWFEHRRLALCHLRRERMGRVSCAVVHLAARVVGGGACVLGATCPLRYSGVTLSTLNFIGLTRCRGRTRSTELR